MLWGPIQQLAQRVRPVSNSPSSQNTSPFLSHKLSGNFQKATPTGSTGNRFSGEKTRSFDKKRMMNISFYFQNKFEERKIPSLNSRLQADQNDPNIKRLCHQWGVVTTVHAPDASISRVSNLKGWCLVIVGDSTTPDEEYADLASKDNVYYLSESYQRKYLLVSAFVQMIPFKSFARKNIGYLFAVGHGAKILFDFDDDNILLQLEDGETIPPPFRLQDLNSGRTMLLKFTEKRYSEIRTPLAFNPYIYMGASHSFSWPRGFPIDKLQDNFAEWSKANSTVKQLGGDMPFSNIGVIQSLCNGDPDNDAVFRMTRHHSTKFSFDKSKSALPLLIPLNKYSPYNAQATTHFYSVFWGLYLPITVSGRVTDIWRSYVTQRLMKELNLHVVYTPPIVTHERSAHDYLADMVAEIPLYDKTEKLLEFLDNWNSNAETLPQMIFDLWVGLYEHNYIEEDDVHAVFEWLKCMKEIGYVFPEVKNRHPNSMPKLPQKQPEIGGQPYRAFPYFNTFNTSAVSLQQVNKSRPENAVLKLILMTMDEWPMLKSWLLYHGQLLGFENLYVIDASTNPKCVSFLRYARDVLGANILFNNANLNQLEVLITRLASDIRGSSDFIMKVDTDEFLGVYDNNTTTALSVDVMEYLAGFATNNNHPLRRLQEKGHSRFGYAQPSIPSRHVCEGNIYATPDQFPLGEMVSVDAFNPGFKAVYSSRHKFAVNLGGHFFGEGFDSSLVTNFGIFHYHSRCVEIEVENCKRVLERHNFISATENKDEVRSQLVKLCNIQPEQNFCEIGCKFRGVSNHKAAFYTKWIDCEESTRKGYYNEEMTGQTHQQLSDALTKSVERFSP